MPVHGAVTPVQTPVNAATDTHGLPLLKVPPEVGSDSVVVLPAPHILIVPVIAAGEALTETTWVT